MFISCCKFLDNAIHFFWQYFESHILLQTYVLCNFLWKHKKIILCVVVFTLSYSYALYSFFIFTTKLSGIYCLSPGWIFNRQRDSFDYQWEQYRSYLPKIFVLMFFHLLLSHLIKASRKRNTIETNRDYFYFNSESVLVLYQSIFGLCYATYLHGSYVLILILYTFINYMLNILIRNGGFASKVGLTLTWLFNLLSLSLSFYVKFTFSSLSISLTFLDVYYGKYLWVQAYRLICLRMISFNMDLYWAVKQLEVRNNKVTVKNVESNTVSSSATKKQFDSSTCSLEKKNVPRNEHFHRSMKELEKTSLPLYNYKSVVRYFAYIYYAPSYISGPIITYNAWSSYVSKPWFCDHDLETKCDEQQDLESDFCFLKNCYELKEFDNNMATQNTKSLSSDTNIKIESKTSVDTLHSNNLNKINDACILDVKTKKKSFHDANNILKETANAKTHKKSLFMLSYIVKDVIKWIFDFLVFEIFTHYIYSNTLGSCALNRVLWKDMNFWQLLCISYFTFIFIWLKFLVIWRLSSLWALLDGIKLRENMPRCVMNNYSISDFWRNWHHSLNAWLIRYIYIPLGGNKNKRKMINSFVVFAYVAFWHEINASLMLWFLITYFSYVLESLGKLALEKDYEFSNNILLRFISRVKNKWYFGQLTLAMNVFNILFLFISNSIGFSIGMEGFMLLLKALLSEKLKLIYVLWIIVHFILQVNILEFVRKHLNEKHD